ncbi:hypothetical protein IVB14_28975 [Bradyrhizobium sp. 180]|uniref:hypothetical protein n=1 Tax=unclassified Bradyrhizobium TaxID=2631580 RepID=UPI001FF71096|nr:MULTISPECIES: hypothetical protein [unclassified Bradyrhizobium]MCK1421702.1 hypothetical protein [Bradyrhizobium sp. CW12]MCK1494338.1 hypothetical protein [Bradyrhizobium sp. 180]MCK1530463.1 hypothetical protein [Bradyrhizobium sp. 182]MCK1594963.1 hypothetical protein [Bradyrhizobium sp. 164]MCK1615670.1 hypothetical protein [Bradyrhizobium sp. 159]
MAALIEACRFSMVRIDIVAPHPLARLRLDDCRIPINRRLGARSVEGGIPNLLRDIVEAEPSCGIIRFE